MVICKKAPNTATKKEETAINVARCCSGVKIESLIKARCSSMMGFCFDLGFDKWVFFWFLGCVFEKWVWMFKKGEEEI